MNEIYGMATLFDSKALDGSAGLSPIERLLNAFEAHEANEDESIQQVSCSDERCSNPDDTLFSCSSLSRTRKTIGR